MYIYNPGPAVVNVITAPTLNFMPNRPVRYAVAFDQEPPQTVTLVPAVYSANSHNPAWDQSVTDNAHQASSRHTLPAAGYHTLKIWMIDPAVVLQKIVVDLGGLKPSYLGPPASFRRPPAVSEKAEN